MNERHKPETIGYRRREKNGEIGERRRQNSSLLSPSKFEEHEIENFCAGNIT